MEYSNVFKIGTRTKVVYISTVRVLARPDNPLKEVIERHLDELGYYVNDGESRADAYVFISPVGIALRKSLKMGLIKQKVTDPVILSITDDGEYVVPLVKEHWGGSLLASLISEVTGAHVVLTSRTAQMGLMSIEEVAWRNGLKITNPWLLNGVEEKLVKEGTLNYYEEDRGKHSSLFPREYVRVEKPEEADLIIGYDSFPDKLVLTPMELVISAGFSSDVRPETLGWIFRITLRSAFLRDDTFHTLLMPNVKQRTVTGVCFSKNFGCQVKFMDVEELKGVPQSTPSDVAMKHFGVEGVCEPMLIKYGARVVLKRTRRAKGVVTCLGVRDRLG